MIQTVNHECPKVLKHILLLNVRITGAGSEEIRLWSLAGKRQQLLETCQTPFGGPDRSDVLPLGALHRRRITSCRCDCWFSLISEQSAPALSSDPTAGFLKFSENGTTPPATPGAEWQGAEG